MQASQSLLSSNLGSKDKNWSLIFTHLEIKIAALQCHSCIHPDMDIHLIQSHGYRTISDTTLRNLCLSNEVAVLCVLTSDHPGLHWDPHIIVGESVRDFSEFDGVLAPLDANDIVVS